MAKTKPKQQNSPNGSETSALSLKERLAQKRIKQEIQQKLIRTAAVCIFLGVLLGIPLALVVGPKLGLLVGLGIPCFVLCFNYPRQALWLFLIYMPFSGTVTYAIGGGNALFQLSKDALYIPALLGLVYECYRKRQPILIPKKLMPTLGLLLVFALMTLFFVNGIQQLFLPYCSDLIGDERFLLDAAGNYILDEKGIVITTPCKVEGGSPFFQGLFGLKVLMGYIPLIFCVHYWIKDKKTLLFLGRVLVVLAIICCVLALVQYWYLKTGRCVGTRGLSGIDLFQPQLSARCLVGGSLLYTPEQGQIRLPGTFVSPWHWAWFLVGNAAICFATAFSDTAFFWRIGGLVGMTLVLVNAVICGQRLALALVPAVIVVLLFLTGQIKNIKRFIPGVVGLSLFVLVAFSAINPDFIQERIDSFVSRWNNGPPQEFIQDQFSYALQQQKGILGRGLGTATNSARAFGNVALVETFHPKLYYEIGPLGLAAYMIFITQLTFLSFKAYRSVRDHSLRSFASCFWVFMLIIGFFPYWYPLDTDPVAVYYWLFAGVVFKLTEIDKQERENLITAQTNEPQPSKKSKAKLTRKRAVAIQ